MRREEWNEPFADSDRRILQLTSWKADLIAKCNFNHVSRFTSRLHIAFSELHWVSDTSCQH